MFNRFFKINRSLCKKIERYLPQARTNIFNLYTELVVQYINSKCNQIIIDVGSGNKCSFAKFINPAVNAKIIAVDMSIEAMENNRDVDEKRVADITQNIPFENNEVDLIVSRSVLEHLKYLDNFIIESKRVLKRNGYCIHLLPSKFAPFAIINQILPKKLSKKLLYFFHPQLKGIAGFPAFYANCYYSSIKSLFEKHDFEIVDLKTNYYQSPYFNFLIPLFLISALYEILLQFIGAKNLSAYILIVAKK